MFFQKYLSIPFQVNKSSFESCDCAGLVFLILQNELGVKIERNSSVDFNAKEKHIIMRQYFDMLEEIPLEEIQKFDIFFQVGREFHTGVVVDKNRVIESTYLYGVKVRPIQEILMKPTKFYRVKNATL